MSELQLSAKLVGDVRALIQEHDPAASDSLSDGATGLATENSGGEESWAANATLCAKCNNKAVVLLDGCQTCMNCGDSKCG